MSRSEFFEKLEQGLSKVSNEDREAALAYYNEYFDDAGEENEQKVIEELGSPAQIAARIKADSAVKHLDKGDKTSVKKGISAVWLVILAIFAAPIALPLAVAAAALSIGLFIGAVAVVFAMVVAVVAVFATGIAILISGIVALATNIPAAIFALGIGFAIIGITILIGILVALAARGIFSAIAKMINKMLHKKSKGDDINE